MSDRHLDKEVKRILTEINSLSIEQKSKLIIELLKTSGVKVVIEGVSEVFSVSSVTSEIFVNVQSFPPEQLPELFSALATRVRRVNADSDSNEKENQE